MPSVGTAPSRPRRFTRFALVVVGVAIMSRAVLLAVGMQLGDHAFLQPDSATYIAPAEAILACGRFAVSAENCGVAEVLRTPGYPLFFAVCRVLFGSSLVPLLASQIGLEAISLLFAFRIADRVAGTSAANAAVLLAAVQANSAFLAVQVLTETLFTALLTGSAWMLVCLAEDERRRLPHAGIAGLLLSAATFVRPTTFFLPWPMAALVMAILVRRCVGWRTSFAAALVFALCAMVPLHAWQLRNRSATGYGGFSSISAASLLLYRAAGVEAIERAISFDEAQALVRARVSPYDPEDPAVSVAEFTDEARAVLSAHPLAVARMTAVGAARLLLGSSSNGLAEQFDLYDAGAPAVDHPVQLFLRAAATAALLVLYPLGCWGIMRCPRGKRALVVLAVFIAAYVVAVSSGPEAYSRFRVPIVPLLGVLAGVGWSNIRRQA